MRKAVEAAGALPFIVAPKVGGATLANGEKLKADGQLAGTPSVLFDAVAIVLSGEASAELTRESAAVQFVMDAYGHLKAIGCSDGSQPLIDKAGIQPDEGVTGLGTPFIAAAAKRCFDREPRVRMMPSSPHAGAARAGWRIGPDTLWRRHAASR